MGNSIAVCGVVCSTCPAHGSQCAGCVETDGMPTWLAEAGMEVCPIYECAVSKHSYATCAECIDLPCDLFVELKDPSITDEEHQKSIEDRVAILKGLGS